MTKTKKKYEKNLKASLSFSKLHTMFQAKHSMEQLHVQMSAHPPNNRRNVASGWKDLFQPMKSMVNVIKKAGIFLLSCSHTHTSLLLPVQLLYVGKLKKPGPWSGCRSNISTKCKTKHSNPIKIQQGWYIKNLAVCCENLPSGKLTSFIATRKIFHKKLTLMLLLQQKTFPCSHEMTALCIILETKFAGQTWQIQTMLKVSGWLFFCWGKSSKF